jgi:hypothetical protein
MGNQAVQRLLRPAESAGALLPRGVFKAGGKGAGDWDAFHTAFGFPEFYGRNMNA